MDVAEEGVRRKGSVYEKGPDFRTCASREKGLFCSFPRPTPSTMLSVGGARAGGFGRTMRPSDMYRAGGVGCGKQQPIPMWCRCN